MTTPAPASASRLALALPMPRPPPVTMATFPFSEIDALMLAPPANSATMDLRTLSLPNDLRGPTHHERDETDRDAAPPRRDRRRRKASSAGAGRHPRGAQAQGEAGGRLPHPRPGRHEPGRRGAH